MIGTPGPYHLRESNSKLAGDTLALQGKNESFALSMHPELARGSGSYSIVVTV